MARQGNNGGNETVLYFSHNMVDVSLAFLTSFANTVVGLDLIFPFIGQQRQGRWDGRREGGYEGYTLMRRAVHSAVRLSVSRILL